MNAARVLIVLAFVVGGGCDGGDPATTKPAETSSMSPKNHIQPAQLEQMFDGIRRQTQWNIDGDVLWGYFVADTRAHHHVS